MRNPITYTLPLIKQGSAASILKQLAHRRKHLKLIFLSFMRRLKVAHKHRISFIEASLNLNAACKKLETANWNGQFAEWDDSCNKLYTQLSFYYSPETWRKQFQESLSYDPTPDSNKHLNFADYELKAFEARAFAHPRANKCEGTVGHREYNLRVAKRIHVATRQLFLDLRKNYPYIRAVHRARLAKIVVQYLNEAAKKAPGVPRPDAVDFNAWDMVKLGVPAADVAGPWWPRTDKIKSPMGFIDWLDTYFGTLLLEDHIEVRYPAHSSPTEQSWLTVAGLDEGDRKLREACVQYYLRHKTAPSVEWARRRSKELEEERKQEDMKKSLPSVRTWLKASIMFRRDYSAYVRDLDGEWRIVKPEDAEELCERAQRDGLCVVDLLKHLSQYSEDRDDCFRRSNGAGVCTLLFSTDPKRRTIVGLNAEGVCTEDHHSTGKDNAVDAAAWKQFRA